MFRFTKKPSSAIHSQYLAKITSFVQCRYLHWTKIVILAKHWLWPPDDGFFVNRNMFGAASIIILKCFNNSTFFTLCALVGIIKWLISLMHGCNHEDLTIYFWTSYRGAEVIRPATGLKCKIPLPLTVFLSFSLPNTLVIQKGFSCRNESLSGFYRVA